MLETDKKAAYPQLDEGREEGEFCTELFLQCGASSGIGVEVNVGGSYDTLLSFNRLQDLSSEFGTGIGHGKGGRSGAIFGLDDFVTTELNTFDESFVVGT